LLSTYDLTLCDIVFGKRLLSIPPQMSKNGESSVYNTNNLALCFV